MDAQPMDLVERRSRFEAAQEALAGITEVLHQSSGPELAELMAMVDGVVARGAAARVAITAEALGRGEIEEAGVNVTAWVRDNAPSLRQGGAGDVATVAQALAPAASRWCPEGGRARPAVAGGDHCGCRGGGSRVARLGVRDDAGDGADRAAAPG